MKRGNIKMKIKSVIKTVFSDEILKLIGSVCDTRRIDSNITKMKVVTELLKSKGIVFEIIGGATNRLVINTKGYLIKIAIDNQGYVDNLIEYSLSPELQPYVTKTYETNGYVLVAKYVKTITLDEFHLRRADILKVLETLSQDYLLGDVGYIDKNFTNWGVEDDGRVVILDYAYMHRGTENLFTCEVCGDGFLRYDSTYTYLKCTNGTVCHAKFSYIDRKIVQGDQVDLDMIEERKADSIILPKGKIEVDLNDDGSVEDGRRVIRTREEYIQYIKEDTRMKLANLDRTAYQDLLISKCMATSDEERNRIQKEMDRLIAEADARDEDYQEPVIEYQQEDDYEDEEESNECYTHVSLDEIINAAREGRPIQVINNTVKKPVNQTDNEPGDEYYDHDDSDEDDIEETDDCEAMSVDQLIDFAISRKAENISQHNQNDQSSNNGKYHINNSGHMSLDDILDMAKGSAQKQNITSDYYDGYHADESKKIPLDKDEQFILNKYTTTYTNEENTEESVVRESNEPVTTIDVNALQNAMNGNTSEPSITINGKSITEYYDNDGGDESNG